MAMTRSGSSGRWLRFVCTVIVTAIAVIPIAVIFLFGQRYFISGIATSGLKG